MRVAGLVAVGVFGASACNVIIGADDPKLRQTGEACDTNDDCMSNLCVVGQCATLSADGGPCTTAKDCTNASSYCNLCVCTACPTPGTCSDFVMCGAACGVPCQFGEKCAADPDCDSGQGLVCDVAHVQCVSQNCKNSDGTFACNITTCAKC